MSFPIIVPIEVKAREFAARLYFSSIALKRGHKVLIGKSKYFHRNITTFPKGVVIENDATPRSKGFLEKARKLGFRTVSWDEESIVTLTDEIFSHLRVSTQCLELLDAFFCRGIGDETAVKKTHPSQDKKVIAAGNPRIDILQPQYCPHQLLEAKLPRQKVILVNSRFSIVNPFYISAEKARENVFRKFGIEKDHWIGQHVGNWLDHAAEALVKFHEMVDQLPQRFPDAQIIIRPHPSEGRQYWEEIADKYENCTCTMEGSAIDWILKSDLLVHNSCTTAIEASLLGVPSFSYLPNYSETYDAPLPNSVSYKFYEQEQYFNALDQQPLITAELIQNEATQARRKLSEHIAGLSGTSCSELVIDFIEKENLKPDPVSFDQIRYWCRTSLQRYRDNFVQYRTSKKVANKLLTEKRQAYQDQKFPPTDTQEIKDTLARFGVTNIDIKDLGNQWWEIQTL